jgi:phage shock protein A
MDDPNGARYTNEYMAQEYRNEAANAKFKLEDLKKENAELKLKIAELEKQVLELKSFYC